ncbi:LpqB family beta-propeller domain-containing protein [Streptacidiphilus albus]|uniref:LpqB family beta-propeller domain-containing protein n=1 Tax=Streptacidiphilus albus TaxID=105425 RepID=UPI0009DEF0D7|nr:LpqB family beta-propeller domain-containing protein [Streptacidiphilus albus]
MRVLLRRSSVRAAGAMALGVVLAGCATMPDSGAPVLGSSDQSSSVQDSQVVVFAIPPQPKEDPANLLSGFIDDLVSDEPDYHTAKDYLAEPKAWNPGAQVTVLDDIQQTPVSGSLASGRMTFEVSGQVEATLDASHTFSPPKTQTRYSQQFVFERDPQGNWQITDLPQGLIISQSDFVRLYESADLYFPAKGSSSSNGTPPMVADPIWVRSRIDPLKAAAQALVSGASSWLGPTVDTAFEPGVSVDSVTVGTDGTARVVLDSKDASLLNSPNACAEMAAQMYLTLNSVPTQQALQAGQQITSAALVQGDADNAACSASSSSAYTSAQTPAGDTAYFVDSAGHLQSLDVAKGRVASVPGLLEPSTVPGIGAFAVAPGGTGQVAVVSPDGEALYISTLQATTAPSHPALQSLVKGAISSPSWDVTGTLWVTDGDPAADSQVMAVLPGGGAHVPVTVEGLPAGARVKGLRVAADGARIAMIVGNGSASTVEVGAVVRSGSSTDPKLTVIALHPIAPALTSVQAVSWQDDDTLMVLGQSATTPAKALSVWEIDGSSTLIPAPAAPESTGEGMTTVAALESNSSAMLLGDSEEPGKIYVWEGTGTSNPHWQPVADAQGAKTGPMPSYPG